MIKQWFISDLHLSTQRPATMALFEDFLERLPCAADRLFILGDLFDAWIGDDDDGEVANRVRMALRRASDRGIVLCIQRGNRDFLMGKRLMRDCKAQLLKDCQVIEIAGRPTLLMHGDLLCTDDIDYQRARRRLRNPLFQWLVLRKSLTERRRLADEYRQRSRKATSMKASDIMDVNPSTVLRYLHRHRVDQLLHGHTHRPAVHDIPLAGGGAARRIVLAEWHATAASAWMDDGRQFGPVEIRVEDTRKHQELRQPGH